MKKLHLILAVVFAIGLTSCGKSAEEKAIDAYKDAVNDVKDMMNNY